MEHPRPPRPAVKRLSLYLRQLERLAEREIDRISSRQIAQSLRIAATQVRKDLAYFGQFGRAGVGYRVGPLIDTLRHILGTDQNWNVVVIGAGDLGRALLRYRGFSRKGFDLVAAFDIASGKCGRKVGAVTVHPLDQLEEILGQYDVKLAVLAIPPANAPAVAERLSRAGVRGILNFAPVSLDMPPEVSVASVDLSAELEQLSFRVAGAVAGRKSQRAKKGTNL